jgi:hypothetical protein
MPLPVLVFSHFRITIFATISMGVFICWSGVNSRSHQLAKVLAERLPEVIQSVDVFLSEHDIGPGQAWMEELRKALKENRFGILCITPENKDSTWIHFEAGSLWKGNEATRVCPLLFDITQAQITGPLAQLQSVEFNKEKFLRLVCEVNEHGCDKPIPDSLLQKTFNRVWPDIEKDVAEIKQPLPLYLPPKRTLESMTEEILELMRAVAHGSESERLGKVAESLGRTLFSTPANNSSLFGGMPPSLFGPGTSLADDPHRPKTTVETYEDPNET